MVLTPSFIPSSHQNLGCLTSGVDYLRFIDDDTAEELLTPLFFLMFDVNAVLKIPARAITDVTLA